MHFISHHQHLITRYVLAVRPAGALARKKEKGPGSHGTMGTYHLTGSCRMGPASDSSTVVGSELKVHGVESLWVADASVMPTEPSGNTYAPTLMIAEKASDMILGKPALARVEL